MAAKDHQSFLAGEGEMAGLICSKDWAATVLGAPDNWAPALKQTVSMMLTMTFPVLSAHFLDRLANGSGISLPKSN